MKIMENESLLCGMGDVGWGTQRDKPKLIVLRTNMNRGFWKNIFASYAAFIVSSASSWETY
jgi:hypothetical protein